MSLDWEAVALISLALSGAERGTYYGKPAVLANNRPLIGTSREPDSFVLHIDRDTVEMLMETDPATFWQTPHYAGWPSVLVRYASDDPERVAAMIGLAMEQAMAKTRKKRRER